MLSCLRQMLMITLIFAVGPSFADLSSRLNTVINQQSNHFDIGVYIANAMTGKVLYNSDGNHPMTPASNTKVMTAAAAYLYLGSTDTFVTSINSNASLGKTINGNVYVKFSGDPTLSTQDLYALAQSLKQQGVTTINGNVVLDQTIFSGPYYGLGWPQDDLAYCYAAPVAGAIINQNCMALQITKKKHSAAPMVHQFTTHFPVVNNVQFVGRRELRTCVFQPTITSNNAILLQGCLPTRANWSMAFSIRNPVTYAQQVVQTALSKANIRVTGKYVNGKTPGNATILARHNSNSLQQIMSYMLKHSDNVYAGAITKTLGASYYGVGSYKGGANAIDAILQARVGTQFKPPYLEDGSGMSTYNLISPQQLVQVLNYMIRQPVLGPIFMQSLAISGQRGTLVYRMTQHGLAGHVFGKTGTINGVSTLSGYLALPGQPIITFAIMMNGIEGGAAHARYVQDQIVQLIANNLS